MAGHAGGVTVRHLGGDRLELAVRGHAVRLDQPVDGGGEDTAPTPTEFLVGSLAACVAFYAERFLRRRGLEAGLLVSADYSWAAGPSRVGAIELRVDAPLLPPELEDAFRRVVEGCPVHNTLAHPPAVRFQVAGAGREAA